MSLFNPKKAIFVMREKFKDANEPLSNEDFYIQIYAKTKILNVKITVEYEKEITL